MAHDRYVEVLLAEYEKQNSIQKDAKDRFVHIALLHNAAIGTAILWLLDKHASTPLSSFTSSPQYMASLAVVFMMNAMLLSGSCYQVFSFFASALRMVSIRHKMAGTVGTDVFASEEDLGRFPHLGVWLARRSESFPVVVWFTAPLLVLGCGLYLSVAVFSSLPPFARALFILSDVLAVMSLVYALGLAIWCRRVGQEEKKIMTGVYR